MLSNVKWKVIFGLFSILNGVILKRNGLESWIEYSSKELNEKKESSIFSVDVSVFREGKGGREREERKEWFLENRIINYHSKES